MLRIGKISFLQKGKRSFVALTNFISLYQVQDSMSQFEKHLEQSNVLKSRV
jgi:hypothetical protein